MQDPKEPFSVEESSSQDPFVEESNLDSQAYAMDYQSRQEARLRELYEEQNFPRAILAAIGAALLGAIIWGVIAILTEQVWGLMALGLGVMVGFAVRYAGNGIEKKFGIMAGGVAILGCVLGNIFSFAWFGLDGGFADYLLVFLYMDYGVLFDIMIQEFGFLDILFFGFAAYEGYRFAFRKFAEEPKALYDQ